MDRTSRLIEMHKNPEMYYAYLLNECKWEKKDIEIAMVNRFGNKWRKNVSQSKLSVYDETA